MIIIVGGEPELSCGARVGSVHTHMHCGVAPVSPLPFPSPLLRTALHCTVHDHVHERGIAQQRGHVFP